jgi:hypothetical protein
MPERREFLRALFRLAGKTGFRQSAVKGTAILSRLEAASRLFRGLAESVQGRSKPTLALERAARTAVNASTEAASGRPQQQDPLPL